MNKATHNPLSANLLCGYGVTVVFFSISYMLQALVPFRAASLGASTASIGFIMATAGFAALFTRPIAGVVTDRFGAQMVVRISLCAYFVNLSGYFVPSIWMLAGMRLVHGINASLFSTAMSVAIMSSLTRSKRGEGAMLYSLSSMAPSLFAASLAIQVRGVVPLNICVMCFLFVQLLNVILAIPFGQRQIAVDVETTQDQTDYPSSPLPARGLALAAIAVLCVSVASGAIFTFLPLQFQDAGLTRIKYYFSFQALVLVLVRYISRRWLPSDNRFPRRLLACLLAVAGIGAVLVSAEDSWLLLVTAAIFNGVAFALVFPVSLTYASLSIPHHHNGLAIGVLFGAADLGVALGAGAMGIVAQRLSFQMMHVTCAMLCISYSIVVLSVRISAKHS